MPVRISLLFRIVLSNKRDRKHNVPEPRNFSLDPEGCNHSSRSVTDVPHQPRSFATEMRCRWEKMIKKLCVSGSLRQDCHPSHLSSSCAGTLFERKMRRNGPWQTVYYTLCWAFHLLHALLGVSFVDIDKAQILSDTGRDFWIYILRYLLPNIVLLSEYIASSGK